VDSLPDVSFNWGSVPDWIAVVLALLGLGLASAALRWRKKLGQWWRQQLARAKHDEAATEADQLSVLRGQVLDVARAQGIGDLAASSTGNGNPTIVTFSDGQRSAYYSDFQTYVRAMNGPGGNPSRTMRGSGPKPVSRWTRAECDDWLAGHTS
jgi:hypothetical protein